MQAGQVIARVNGCQHLHFSTHPGTKYRDGNPYAGHVPKSWADHGGYVDPVKFLKTNPRAAAYKPPALPQTEVVTTSAPLRFGAADGAAYWTEEGGAGSVTWRTTSPPASAGRSRPARPSRPSTRGGTASSFSPRRRSASPSPITCPSRRSTAKHDTPPWGAEAELTASLTNAAGAPLQGAIVKLQRLKSGWQNVGLDVTGADGEAVFLYTPASATSLRVVFAPPAEQPDGHDYLIARSRAKTVTPHVALTTPRLPAVVDAADLVDGHRDPAPAHPAGEHTVRLEFQRRGAGGDWVSKLTVAAVNRDADGGEATRYVGHARLTRRLVARARDASRGRGARALHEFLADVHRRVKLGWVPPTVAEDW